MSSTPFHIFMDKLKEHPNKPRFAAPCNNCGLCCATQACRVSIGFLKSDVAPCVALEKETDGKWVCGVYKQPSKYLANPPATDAILRVMLDKEFLHIGEGCGMPDNVKLVRIGEPGEPIAWVSIQEREEALG